MSENTLTVHTTLTPTKPDPVPAAIAILGDQARESFIDFFTAKIRNANTRAAYYRNVTRFLAWLEEHRVELRDVRPVHVAGYIELLGQTMAAPSVKQHLAAIRMFGSFLVVRQVIASNPALDVRGPKHVTRVGKTPVLNNEDARTLFASIDPSTPAGVRDRAILGMMVYTFGRISAVLGLDLEDYYQVGRTMRVRMQAKGGQDHEMPVHHTLIEYLDAYIAKRGDEPGPLFFTINRRRTGYTEQRLDRREALAMVKRRCRAAGLGEKFSNHTFRGTGITAYLKNDGPLDQAQQMAGHASPSTTKLYDRRDQEASLDEVERIIL